MLLCWCVRTYGTSAKPYMYLFILNSRSHRVTGIEKVVQHKKHCCCTKVLCCNHLTQRSFTNNDIRTNQINTYNFNNTTLIFLISREGLQRQ